MIWTGLLLVVATATATATASQAPRASMDGFGPARIGMTRAALAHALGEPLVEPYVPDEPGCTFVYRKSKPDGPAYMLLDERLARVDFSAADGVATVSGARIGMGESEILRLYTHGVAVTQHAYGDAGDHYLTIHSRDGKRGVRFEATQGKVDTFYIGTAEAIEYIEGCS